MRTAYGIITYSLLSIYNPHRVYKAMKKNLYSQKIFLISLLLSAILILSSCNYGASEDAQTIQEPTEELLIYVPPNLRFQVNSAIRMFEEEFPHVQVEVRTFTEKHPPSLVAGGDLTTWLDGFTLDVSGMEEFNQALRNGLITHRAPDVVIWSDIVTGTGNRNTSHLPYSLLTFPDLFKTAGWTDLFLDLEPLFLADPDFDRQDVVEGIYDVGLIGEQRRFVPLMYHLPILITTEEALEYFGLDVGFDDELCSSQLMEIIEQFVDENQSNSERFLFPPPDRGLRYIYPWLGGSFIDYYSGTVNIQNDTFLRAIYFYRMIYDMTTSHSSYTLNTRYGGAVHSWTVAGEIYSRNVLFNFTMGYRTFGDTYALLSSMLEGRTPPSGGGTADDFFNESPVWFPLYGIDDAPVGQPVLYAAIPRATSNQYNAYEFLRILMSKEWQFKAMHSAWYGMDVYPVNRYALIRAIDDIIWNLDFYDVCERWACYLPYETKEKWLEFVWSATADENFTHTSLRIVHEYMLPFFRGEATFEESLSLLENKLTIYVGE